MSRHLTQTEHGVVTLEAVVVSLLLVVVAALDVAGLRGGELLEACSVDRVSFLVLPPVGHHLVGVCAHEVAFLAVEVRRLILLPANHRRVDTIWPAAGHVGPVLGEVSPHEGVQTVVPSRVLHEAGLVAEGVAAVLPHAVEVRLVLAVAAVRVLAVLVEPEPVIAFRNGFVLNHPG